MKRKVIVLILFIILLCPQIIYAQSSFVNLADNNYYYEGRTALSLGSERLLLPFSDRVTTDSQKNFSSEAQEKLFDIASRFDRSEKIENYNLSSEIITENINLDDRVITYNGEKLQYYSSEPFTDVLINADYKGNVKDMESLLQTSLNVNYQLNSKTTLRAEYSLQGRKWQDTEQNNNLQVDNVLEDENSNTDNNIDEEEIKSINLDNTDNTSQLEKPLTNSEINQQSSFGISYQSSDNLVFSADYVKNNIFRDFKGDSTILGLEYIDNEGSLSAKYEIIYGEEGKKTITGLELDLKDLASFFTSYELLDTQMIKDKLDKESVWDIGVDINLSEATIFSLDYKLIDNDLDKNQDFLKDLKEKESNINASFKIKF